MTVFADLSAYQVSSAAVRLMQDAENPSPYCDRVCWPGGASGLTIGYGFDCGYTSAAEIAAVWGGLLPDYVARLQSYAGLTGAGAQIALHATVDISVPQAAAASVFSQLDLPRAIGQTVSAFANCDQLSPDSLGALVSLVFNRGPGLADPPGRPGTRLEMREIADAMATCQFWRVPSLIRAMKRIWLGQNLNGLCVRRDAEAALFVQGLDLPATPASFTSGPNWMHQGNTGPSVYGLQAALVAHGAAIAIDGVFGPTTDAAVRAFQANQRMSVDGIAGMKTLTALGLAQ